MSVSSFFHTLKGGVVHVFKWVFAEEPKIVAETEKVTVEVETYIGSNKVLAAIADPIKEALETEATAFVTQAKTAFTAGTPVTTMVSIIATDLRADGSTILSKVEATVLPQ